MSEGVSCIKCHRGLKRPESIARSMGPVCARKESLREQPVKEGQYDGGNIVCQRTARGIETNVPHTWVYHSPDGFEWGYDGSGPAEFALNIMLLFLPRDMAFRLHQEFKWKFVAALPHEGGTILLEDINNWLLEQPPVEGDGEVTLYCTGRR